MGELITVAQPGEIVQDAAFYASPMNPLPAKYNLIIPAVMARCPDGLPDYSVLATIMAPQVLNLLLLNVHSPLLPGTRHATNSRLHDLSGGASYSYNRANGYGQRTLREVDQFYKGITGPTVPNIWVRHRFDETPDRHVMRVNTGNSIPFLGKDMVYSFSPDGTPPNLNMAAALDARRMLTNRLNQIGLNETTFRPEHSHAQELFTLRMALILALAKVINPSCNRQESIHGEDLAQMVLAQNPNRPLFNIRNLRVSAYTLSDLPLVEDNGKGSYIFSQEFGQLAEPLDAAITHYRRVLSNEGKRNDLATLYRQPVHSLPTIHPRRKYVENLAKAHFNNNSK